MYYIDLNQPLIHDKDGGFDGLNLFGHLFSGYHDFTCHQQARHSLITQCYPLDTPRKFWQESIRHKHHWQISLFPWVLRIVHYPHSERSQQCQFLLQCKSPRFSLYTPNTLSTTMLMHFMNQQPIPYGSSSLPPNLLFYSCLQFYINLIYEPQCITEINWSQRKKQKIWSLTFLPNSHHRKK